ncbi:MAG: DUF72 domain-containing protein [Candidatus Eremiobacteraeota bacterium]|nr:DUF72 domain-containing protein [Candidatus Eremiobacteraeota bacterium]MBV9057433.1 DUF72 domain-containing protein [Candidatus Eremiobacteraeota bacterium]MBV9699474.1 DUF72 domain-containing protein [Candidatus Eremiobacteraeota bacterium]
MIRIGTSGWVYGDWRDRFYPKGVPQRRWLAYYAERFDTVELNATTYRLPTMAQVQLWCESVPPQFRYTVKLSRLITHRRDLPERIDRFIANYFERAACFTPEKLAQILVQFPPYLKRDDAHLETFLRKLPPEYHYVVEFRNASWFAPDIADILRRRNVAFCIHDYPGMRVPPWITSNATAYVRFHGAAGLYVGSYSRRSLRRWADKIAELATQANDVYVYFNNDTAAAAPHDAAALRKMLLA